MYDVRRLSKYMEVSIHGYLLTLPRYLRTPPPAHQTPALSLRAWPTYVHVTFQHAYLTLPYLPRLVFRLQCFSRWRRRRYGSGGINEFRTSKAQQPSSIVSGIWLSYRTAEGNNSGWWITASQCIAEIRHLSLLLFCF